MTYDEFKNLLEEYLFNGEELYLDLLSKIIERPERYIGIFRASGSDSKLIQNITQSQQIRFGDFLERVTKKYLQEMGYTIINSNLNSDDKKYVLDLYFKDENEIFFVEMKVRDDHDSTKKVGQFNNFKNKIELLLKNDSIKHLNASMWFVDDLFKANRKYYKQSLDKLEFTNTTLHLYYGDEFFISLNHGEQKWNEFIKLLKKYRREDMSQTTIIPNFGKDEVIFNVLLLLTDRQWNRLVSNNEKMKAVREEFFSEGDNLERARIARKASK